jgi:hypothetical protein
MHIYEMVDIDRCIETIKKLSALSCLSTNDLADKLPFINETANSLDILTVRNPEACTIVHTHVTEFKLECVKALHAIADKYMPMVDQRLKQLVDEKVTQG